MSRRLAVAAVTVLVALGAVAPALAAPKPVKGSYEVTLLPDPALNELEGCEALNPLAVDDHPFTVPAAGLLDVTLVSEDLGGLGQSDWDLYLIVDGEIFAASEGATATEQIRQKFKKKTELFIQVCNIKGDTEGTVTYSFTPLRK